MATITITINTDNSVFDDSEGGVYEVKRILNAAANRLEQDGMSTSTGFKLLDGNGNSVGRLDIED